MTRSGQFGSPSGLERDFSGSAPYSPPMGLRYVKPVLTDHDSRTHETEADRMGRVPDEGLRRADHATTPGRARVDRGYLGVRAGWTASDLSALVAGWHGP